MATKKVNKQREMALSAGNGQIVSKEFAKKNPGGTVVLKIKQLTDKQKALGGLYMVIEGVKQGTGMSMNQILKAINKRFAVKK